jgi:UrcA family protein
MDVHNESSGIIRRALVSVLAVMGALGATAALTFNAPIVSSEGQPRTVRVEYGDLNLATHKGKEVLSQRIRQAVDLVCYQPDPRALQMWSEYRKCMQSATDSAWSQIHWSEKPLVEAAGTVRSTP